MFFNAGFMTVVSRRMWWSVGFFLLGLQLRTAAQSAAPNSLGFIPASINEVDLAFPLHNKWHISTQADVQLVTRTGTARRLRKQNGAARDTRKPTINIWAVNTYEDAYRQLSGANRWSLVVTDIGLTEQKSAEIDAYEAKARLARPWQFGMTQRGG